MKREERRFPKNIRKYLYKQMMREFEDLVHEYPRLSLRKMHDRQFIVNTFLDVFFKSLKRYEVKIDNKKKKLP